MTTTHLINTLSYPYPLLFTFVSTLYHPLRVAPETPLQQVRRQVKEWDVIALSHERANTKKEDEEREQSQEQKRRDKEARARERMQARLGAHPLNVPPCQYTVSSTTHSLWFYPSTEARQPPAEQKKTGPFDESSIKPAFGLVRVPLDEVLKRYHGEVYILTTQLRSSFITYRPPLSTHPLTHPLTHPQTTIDICGPFTPSRGRQTECTGNFFWTNQK